MAMSRPVMPPLPIHSLRNLWRPSVTRADRAIAGCALLLLLCVAGLDPGIDFSRGEAFATILQRLILNLLPVLAAFALLLAATRRVLLSTWLLLLLLGGLYAANASKLGALQMPLLPADLLFFAEPGPALRLFSEYLRIDAAHFLLALAAAAITLLLLREQPHPSLHGWRGAALGLLALLSGGSLLAGSGPWRQIYHSTALGFQPWALDVSATRTGLIGSLLLYHWEIGGHGVPSPDREAAIALLQAHAPELRAGMALSTTHEPLPDIVVVQSESLFDPARLRGVLSDRWLSHYHALARRAQGGNLVVPTFAGGTIRTEFEVLTGAPLSSLGGIQYPWLELDESHYAGLTRVLNAHGYATTALHPNAAAFWNRARSYPALGFDRFIDGASFPQDRIVGLFTADAALTDRILDELADDGPPQFLFAVSMENHGPFDWRPNLDPQRLAALPMPETLDAGARLWFGNYLYLLDDADQELGRLADALARRKRRTLLLFYGDHLPDLAPVYEQLGFDDGRAAKTQPVPWLLLDNRNRQQRRTDTQAWMLPARLLDIAGIHDDAYFNLVASLARSPDFDPADARTRAGIDALAQLHLRGELTPLVESILAPSALDSTVF